jgi:hypothetical protein
MGGDDEALDDDDDDDDDNANQDLTIDKRMAHTRTMRYIRNDKMRLDRFMELANIASTKLSYHYIEFSMSILVLHSLYRYLEYMAS